MKKKIFVIIAGLSALLLSACGENKANYTGYWQGQSNMIFEVLSNNGSDFIIRNINGDLTAKIQDGSLRGKNTLDMEYVMNVKGDSAYYEFGGVTTGYKRISKQEYDRIFETLQKNEFPK